MIPRTPRLAALVITIGCNSASEPPVAQIPVSKVLAVVEPLEVGMTGYGNAKWSERGPGEGFNSLLIFVAFALS